MKKVLLFLLALFPLRLFAEIVEIEGIHYQLLKSKYAEIHHSYYEKVSGDVSIPQTISIDGIDYTITKICDSAFFGCSNLRSITIPEGVTEIGGSAFEGCTSLISVKMPESVVKIGDKIFKGCKSISSLDSVSFPNHIKKIPESAFYGCSSIKSVDIPKGVTEIGSYAFSSTGINTLIIPQSVYSIGYKAFANCSDLETVFCYIPASEIGPSMSHFFEDSFIEYATLYVPKNSVSTYQQSVPWSGFGQVLPLIEEGNRCAKPIIKYANGHLSFNSETDGTKFVCKITNTDIKEYKSSNIDLTVTYNISVYATRPGYTDSETAAATLCWLESDPKTEGINDITRLSTIPVLISSVGSTLNITGAENVDHIEFYNLSGSYLGSEQVINGEASFETDENLVIVKIAEKSIKVKK